MASNNDAAITLYTLALAYRLQLCAETPNGWKPSIVLEELNVPYDVKRLDITTNVQKEPWFLKINPNGRIPAIVDHRHGDFQVFESGAILLWLVQNYDPEHTLWPSDPKLQSQVMQWVMFQMAGVGPMQGQANHFTIYAKEKIPYAIERYKNETKRLYTVLEDQLKGQEYLVNNQYTIADIINFTWVLVHTILELDVSDLPNLRAWLKRIAARPAVQKGLNKV
ncbi:Glutathione S-transferase 2 [Dimargaris xerosporica]|nr:Glutathione S-transferase 2 [Dimargaris xerosporica]